MLSSLKQQANLNLNPVEQLKSFVEDDFLACNAYILEKTNHHIPLIHDVAQHLINAGGKRLRPLLTLATSKLCGYTGTRHQLLAACIEFIHTATLLHDDVVDTSHIRRGLATANHVWGNKTSILVGDFLFSRAFEFMVEDGEIEILRILSATTSILAEGEVKQLIHNHDETTNIEAYLDIIQCKTAALFAAATEISAVISKKGLREQQALRAFGLNLGLAFQITDDILDYQGEVKTFGKTQGNDFAEGKMTLPIIYFYQSATKDDIQLWQQLQVSQHADSFAQNFLQAQNLLKTYHCFDKARTEAESYIIRAKESLTLFPDHPIKDALIALCDYCIHRTV